eukprot:PhF_6_TR42365/c0_g1_i1/m.63915
MRFLRNLFLCTLCCLILSGASSSQPTKQQEQQQFTKKQFCAVCETLCIQLSKLTRRWQYKHTPWPVIQAHSTAFLLQNFMFGDTPGDKEDLYRVPQPKLKRPDEVIVGIVEYITERSGSSGPEKAIRYIWENGRNATFHVIHDSVCG